MRLALVLFFVAGCGGSMDAPRPIADSPVIDDNEEPGLANTPADDDGDGVPNDADLCPLARESYNPSNPDGCPDTPGADAGV
jgi:hypothetical protein